MPINEGVTKQLLVTCSYGSSDDMITPFWGMFAQPSNDGRMIVVDMNSRKTVGKTRGSSTKTASQP